MGAPERVLPLTLTERGVGLAVLNYLLALGFATGFTHYRLDRAAFRFSSPDVRQAAAGLLLLLGPLRTDPARSPCRQRTLCADLGPGTPASNTRSSAWR